jgi:hypothetical protein
VEFPCYRWTRWKIICGQKLSVVVTYRQQLAQSRPITYLITMSSQQQIYHAACTQLADLAKMDPSAHVRLIGPVTAPFSLPGWRRCHICIYVTSLLTFLNVSQPQYQLRSRFLSAFENPPLSNKCLAGANAADRFAVRFTYFDGWVVHIISFTWLLLRSLVLVTRHRVWKSCHQIIIQWLAIRRHDVFLVRPLNVQASPYITL